MNLEEIIIGCKKQSITHQKELYLLFNKTLFNLSLKYCTSVSEAEDNLHDSFMEIFSNIDQYKGNGSFEGWMKRITINKAIQLYKKNINFKTLDNHSETEEIAIDFNETHLSLDQILEAVQALPNQYRLVFNLYELDEYSHKEIAQILNISEGTSKSNLFKAKSILKKNLSELQLKKVHNG